jgi:hypothetical protein
MHHCDLHFNFKYYYMGVRLKPVGIKWGDSKKALVLISVINLEI